MPDLSIVTTMFRSEPFIGEFHARASAAARALGGTYEIVFVDDGSPDRSLELVRELARSDPCVRIVELSRNFGHHIAAYAAIEAARGDRVFLIDSDLEEHPEWLAEFDKVMKAKNADVVFGVQADAAGARGMSGLFYRVFNALSEVYIPPHACTVRLMRRAYVDSLTQLRDHKLFMAGMFMWTGFNQVGVPVDKGRRSAGKSTYNLRRQVGLFIDAITSFSSKPLYAAFFVGSGLATAAGAIGAFMVGRKLLFPDTVLAGFTALFVSVLFIGGLIILFLGVIGIYLSKIFAEVKDRPLYIARPASETSHRQAESTP